MSRFRTAVGAVAMLLLVACKDKAPQPVAVPPPATAPPAAATPGGIGATTFAPSLGIDLKASTKTPSGLYYRDIKVGSGPVATSGQQVSVNYVGSFADGTEFERSPEPIVFPLGVHRVIAGWDEGLVGMRVGGKRQLIIPPDLGYGPGGSGKIPPNAILIFAVELVAVK